MITVNRASLKSSAPCHITISGSSLNLILVQINDTYLMAICLLLLGNKKRGAMSPITEEAAAIKLWNTLNILAARRPEHRQFV